MKDVMTSRYLKIRGTQRIVSAEYLLAGLNRLRYSNLIAKKLEISLAKHHRLS